MDIDERDVFVDEAAVADDACTPEQLELEQRIIGAIQLGGQDVMERLADRLDFRAFYDRDYAELFTVFRAMQKAGLDCRDAASVRTVLAQRHDAEKTPIYNSLLNAALREAELSTGTANVEGYADLINDAAQRRWLRDIFLRGREAALNPDLTPEWIIGQTIRHVQRIDELMGGQDAPIRTAAEQMKHVQQFIGTRTGWDIGLSKIGDLSGGLNPQELWVVGGMTGTGKSRIDIYLAARVAANGVPSAIINLEMADFKFGEYFASTVCNLRDHRVTPRDLFRSGSIEESPVVAGRWQHAKLAAEGLDFYCLEQAGGASMAEIKRWCRGLANRGVRIVFIDQVQRVREYRASVGKERGGLVEVFNGMKDIAADYNICVVALHQLNRPGYDVPALGNLSETAAAEHTADHVLIFYDPQRHFLSDPAAEGFVMDGRRVKKAREKDVDDPTTRVYTEPTNPRPIKAILDKTRGTGTGTETIMFHFGWGVQVDEIDGHIHPI